MFTAYAVNAAEKVTGETAGKLAQLIELMIAKIPLLIAGFIVIIFSVIAAKIARKIVENKMAEKGIEEEHKEVQILGGRLTYATILTLGATIGLKIGGIDLTTILAAVAFGIGFALKDMIMNFLAGIMILVGRHFTIGDFIHVGGTIGRVVEIQSRVTILQAIDGTKVIVPNAELFRKQVTSYTSNPFRRIEVEIGVDYRTDLKNALKVCLKTVKSTQGILLEPKPAVLVSEWGDSEVVVKVRAWVESRGGWLKIKSQLLSNLKQAFEDYKIDFAWPIRQVVYDKELEHGEGIHLEDEKEEKTKHEPLNTPPQAELIKNVREANTNKSPEVATLRPVPVIVDLDDGQPLKPLGEK